MLPSLVAREVHYELAQYLLSRFPVSTPAFNGAEEAGEEDAPGLMQRFLFDPARPHNLFQGPWLEVKLPFRTAEADRPLPLQHIKLGFTPYMHQQIAFERLTGMQAQSTIVATGTGSGKTECFLYPILEYCLNERRPGVKAIIIYPMNALAADQARRFAKEVSGLDTRLTVGLFTGDRGQDSRVMTDTQVITNHQTLRDNPPDILLTNYKMLDFLLLRPKDQPLWRFNMQTQGLLRYLVVDELHTFDGAQGTDLACLLRRLRYKLNLDDSLICVGTSATIGSESAENDLAQYASTIFHTKFTTESIVREDRLSVDEYLQRFAAKQTHKDADLLSELPAYTSPQELLSDGVEPKQYLRYQANLWLGVDLALDSDDQDEYNAACVELGQLLHQHLVFRSLLRAAHDLVDVYELADSWQQDFNLPDRAHALALIDSLVALISTARVWQPGSKKKVWPFLNVRVQLWMRELSRMLASVGPLPQLTYGDDVPDPNHPLHLPVVHCQECHATAWGARRPQGEHRLRTGLRDFYVQWFARSPDAVLLYPLLDDEEPPAQSNKYSQIERLCTECHQLYSERDEQCPQCKVPTLRVWIPHMARQVERGEHTRLQRDDACPRCGAWQGLYILGARAASLASVVIGQLFGSQYNDDRKLIAFSDSVQDAAHRAGYFGDSTYPYTIRQGVAHVARRAGQTMNLERFIDEVPRYWERQLGPAQFIGTFIGPNMKWLPDYNRFLATEGKEITPSLLDAVRNRLRWQALIELGQRAGQGRTLERSLVAVIYPQRQKLHEVAKAIQLCWQEELGQLKEVSVQRVISYLLGLLRRLRQRGAFFDEVLVGYVQAKGSDYLLGRNPWLPHYGFFTRPPAALTMRPVSKNFENLVGRGARWYVEWFNKTIAFEGNVFATVDYQQAMHLMLLEMQQHKWFTELYCGTEPAWLMQKSTWLLSTQLLSLACDHCGNRQTVASLQQADWLGLPCLQAGCLGHYAPDSQVSFQGYEAYNQMPVRLNSAEHTALLDDKERQNIERSFISAKRNSWSTNLLSATPTLEMGINIGDLSAVLLCSVPPNQANYLQRIGRAGRQNGNALALTIANANNHDNYFYSEPLEMIAGDVPTPGVFLDATAVLERQLIAFCFDAWVSDRAKIEDFPERLGAVLNALQAGQSGHFPENFFDYIETHQIALLQHFLFLFPELQADGQAHLRRFMGIEPQGGKAHEDSAVTLSWLVLNRLQQLLEQRESHQSRARALYNRIEVLRRSPQDEARDQNIKELQRERNALLALIRSINRQHTLNFFTDEGLLPNYAFPEAGVTLDSVIVRSTERRADDFSIDDTQQRYERVSFKFQRLAQAALSELAPNNVFYASEYKINIEQVDLNVEEPKQWRLCPQCHYCEDLTTTDDEHSACPRCGTPYWRDVLQKQTMLRLRQVYARVNARYDRISDDSEEREPKFYQRQLLIDIHPRDSEKAYRIDSEELPFGFEYIRSATFREINFGELAHQQHLFSVAGEEMPRGGFQVCKECGMVRREYLRKGQYEHALDCRFAQDDHQPSEDDWFDSLYLFRELHSEAIRILLPLADVAEFDRGRRSLIAAIHLGLRAYFRGAVQHLEVTEMREPTQVGHRQYLVIYDRIPGGSGYLKQLLVAPQTFFTMLEMARDTLRDCSCANDMSKDGCYRCILAYRTSRYQQDISRQAALNLLSRILAHQDKVIEVEGLGQIPTNSLLESALEERLVQALGRHFSVHKQRVNNKPGYWIDTGTRMWELEPQVEFGQRGEPYYTRADFVLRPLKEADRGQYDEWVIYADGFDYHWDRMSDDLLRRLHLLRQGYRVWVLTWEDLAAQDDKESERSRADILRRIVQRQSEATKLWHGLAKSFGWRSVNEVRGLIEQGSFDWLLAWLRAPQQVQDELQQSALCLSLLQLQPRTELTDFVEQIRSEQGNWREALLVTLPNRAADWQALVSNGYEEQNYWQLISHLLPEQRNSLRSAQPQIEAFLTVNDLLYQDVDKVQIVNRLHSPAIKAFYDQWRMVWQAFNILQFAPMLSIATLSGLREGAFAELTRSDWPIAQPMADEAEIMTDAALGVEPGTKADGQLGAGPSGDPATGLATGGLGTGPDAKADRELGAGPSVEPSAGHEGRRQKEWAEVFELAMLKPDDLKWVQQIAPTVPIVGEDLVDATGATIGTAELFWAEQQVALFLEAETELPQPASLVDGSGWVLISIENEHWQQQLKQAFAQN